MGLTQGKREPAGRKCDALLLQLVFFLPGFFVFSSLFFFGCSRQEVSARVYLYRAGQVYFKTDNTLRRVKRMPFEQRKKFYAEACTLYYKAFQIDSGVFDLDEIEHALQCCESGDRAEISEAFQNFYEVYQAEHPVESEYGMISGGVSDG